MTPAQNLPALLSLNHDDFVECAYFTILNRPADATGLTHYVDRLLAGDHKLAILSALYGSDEARIAKVNIPWLRGAILRHKLARLPVVRLAFSVSDRRNAQLQSERKLYELERKVRLLIHQVGACASELTALSGALQRVGESADLHSTIEEQVSDTQKEFSGASQVAKRVYRALLDAIDREAADTAKLK